CGIGWALLRGEMRALGRANATLWMVAVRAPRPRDFRPRRVADDRARNRADRGTSGALLRACLRGRERQCDGSNRDDDLHAAPPPVWREASWRRMRRQWGAAVKELRLQILLEDRHFERDAAVIDEHDADELVAGVQIGRIGLGRALVHHELGAELLLQVR